MTISGVTTGLMTASDLVSAALSELGVISAGETPTGEDLENGVRELNWALKSWASRGVNLWREADASVTFPAGTATMTLVADCLDVMEARFVQSSTYERQMQRWEWGQYHQLPNKAQRGFPTIYFIRKAVAGVTMSLWPVPNADATILYSYSRIPQDVTDGAQTVDLPQQWTEALWCALAARLASTYGVTRTDPATSQVITQRAASLERLLLDDDRPASVFLGAWNERYF